MKIMRNVLVWMMLFVVASLISCGQGTTKKNNKDNKTKDPELKLVYLSIFGDEIDLSRNSYSTQKETVCSDDITAKFNYGTTEDEALEVVLEKEDWSLNKAADAYMVMNVPAVAGRYAAWQGQVKMSFEQHDMENLFVGYNGEEKDSGSEETLSGEIANFLIEAKDDLVKEVVINNGKQDYTLPMNELVAGNGEKYYQITKPFVLDVQNATTFSVLVIPKDKLTYREKEFTYILKGTTVPNNNAEFAMVKVSDDETEPDVVAYPVWEEGCGSDFLGEYGAKSVKFVAMTQSPRAHVFAKMVDAVTNAVLPGKPEVELTNTNGVHSGEIKLFDDKSTKVILYVKAEDGTTTDDTNGKWANIFNPVDVYFEYDAIKIATYDGRSILTAKYDNIEVEKSKVQNGKVYLAFVAWGKKFGYAIAEDAKTANYEELDSFGGDDAKDQTAHKITVDVSKLQVGSSTEVTFPIMLVLDRQGNDMTPIKAFTYKVKITMK